MPRNRRFWLLWAPLLGFSACDEASEAGLGGTRSVALAQPVGLTAGSGPSYSPSPALRYIALMPANQPCPNVGDWFGRRLFRLTERAQLAWDALAGTGHVMPPVLARFCVYMSQSATPSGPPVVPGAVRVDPDASVVIPQAAMTPNEARADHLLAQLGASPNGSTPPTTHPYGGDPFGLPYVAVVDTADSTEPGTIPALSTPSSWAPPHRHGLSMGALIEAARCPFALHSCRARQFFAQAFPFEEAQASPEPVSSGGQWSSLGSLASAIGESLAGWRAQPDSASAPLVVNLSLGWDPTHGSISVGHESLLDPFSPDASVPANVQAVHSALAWASCQDVVAVAASGNARGPGCAEEGALAPASWESLPAVSASTCSAIAGSFATGNESVALVYGAGGVNDGLQPIDNARIGSLPARVSYAHQGTVTVAGEQTRAWTGSSLASASLSALTASLLSYGESIPASSVIAIVDASGTPVPFDADWLQPEVSGARRITFDRAFEAALGSSPYTVAGGGRVGAAITKEILGTLQTLQSPAWTTLSADPSASSTCGPTSVDTFVAQGGATPPSVLPETDELRPQPHVPICPVFNMNRSTGSTPSFSLHIDIYSAYAPATIAQASLSLTDPVTSTAVSVPVPTAQLGTRSVVVDLARLLLPTGASVSDWLASHRDVKTGELVFSVDLGRGSQPIRQSVDVVF